MPSIRLGIEEGEGGGRLGDAASDEQFGEHLRQARGFRQLGRCLRVLLGKHPSLLGTTKESSASHARLSSTSVSCAQAGRAHRAYSSSS